MTACRNISSGDLPVGPHPDTHSHRTRSRGAPCVSGNAARRDPGAAAGPAPSRAPHSARRKSSLGCRNRWPAAEQRAGEPSILFVLLLSSPEHRESARAGKEGRQEPVWKGGVRFPPCLNPQLLNSPLWESLRGCVTQKEHEGKCGWIPKHQVRCSQLEIPR